MSKAGSISHGAEEMLHPNQVEAVRRHLQELLDSQSFANSKRSQDFLRLIVTHALEGDIDSLRERMIGAEMFGRPVSYDTGSDSVVRVRASELRKKLALFYTTEGTEKPPVRFELPSGSYVPRFHFPNTEKRAPVAEHDIASATAADAKDAQKPEPLQAALAAPSEMSKRSGRGGLVLSGAAVGVLIVVLAGYVGIRRWQEAASARKAIHAVAILPLQNLSGIPSQEYFADGMTEELINDLGQVSTLRVISLTSSMSYKGTKKNLPQIARELSVDAVVEGGVLREGDQVRISTQLIDARTDRPLWAHTYVRDLTSDLAWQGEVAQAIAGEISTTVTPQEQARLTRKRPLDPQAQDLYLHGILLRENDDCAHAIDYFNQAITRDAGYAQAHSALASCYGMMGEAGRMFYQEAFSRQKAEATRAIELDDSLSEAHAELANTAMTLDWDWPRAEAEFRRALELNPNSATSRQKYAFYLVRTGHVHEALAEVERAVELDPVSGSTFHTQGFVNYFARRYDEALAMAQTVRGLKVSLSDWSFLIGDIQAEKGNYSQSIAEFLKSGSGPYTLGHLGNAYARAGQIDAARGTIAELEKQLPTEGVGRYEIALVYVGLGEKRDAFKWLEDAYRAHDVGLVYLKVDPCLDPLRSDPRFDDLLRRVGLAR
ncbi:MAG: tetratricopeptide repeat protein [Terracidiphilus sp.]|jgi:TolB-like protein